MVRVGLLKNLIRQRLDKANPEQIAEVLAEIFLTLAERKLTKEQNEKLLQFILSKCEDTLASEIDNGN